MMQKQYKHIFFDLDRTLWDFEKSAIQAFEAIFKKYKLKNQGIPSYEELHEKYTVHNNNLWDKYRKGEIDKETLKWLRFYLTMKDFGIDDRELADKIGEEYVKLSPVLVNLFPHAIEILEYLHKKNYLLHLITNGFSEVQNVKLKVSGMDKFFETVVTSEEAGVKKPLEGIFRYAFDKSGANPDESIMIGDDYEVDIVGAQNVGMNQILFDPHENYNGVDVTYKVKNLREIETIL